MNLTTHYYNSKILTSLKDQPDNQIIHNLYGGPYRDYYSHNDSPQQYQ